jgi:hypothetical protein
MLQDLLSFWPSRRDGASLTEASRGRGQREQLGRSSEDDAAECFKHLKVLREAGFVSSRTEAQRRIYRLELDRIRAVDAWLSHTAICGASTSTRWKAISTGGKINDAR